MPAPAFLTEPSDPETALIVGMPMIAVMYVVTKSILEEEDDVRKGAKMVASGLAVMALVVAASSVCDGSKKGICKLAPTRAELWHL